MNDKIFDTQILDDLPADIKEEICGKRGNFTAPTQAILDLFLIKKQLNNKEIRIGLYRAHGFNKSRAWIGSTLNNLVKGGYLKKLENKKATYKLITHNKNK